MKRRGELLPALVLTLASLLGAWAFLRPMLRDEVPDAGPAMDQATAQAADAPLLLALLLGLCLLAVVAQLETRRMDARLVAVLGVLVGVNACLRLVTGPLGASAFFVLPILCGYVFGAGFGFLLATLAMLASALLTGGLGPWLPFQMLAAGWCGLLSGWLPRLDDRRARYLLAAWGAVTALLYGALVNLWFWPFLQPVEATQGLSQHWEPGMALREALARYLLFYAATSSWWDAGRAVGNAVLLFALTTPALRLLGRFEKRFRFERE